MKAHYRMGSVRLTALLGVAVLGIVWLGWRLVALPRGASGITSTTALAEVERSALTLVEGRLRASGQEGPFTGWMLERYREGGVMSRSWVSSGVLAGMAEGFHPDGRLQVREYFVEGVSHGIRTRWHTNGVKQSEGQIVNGRIEGVFQRWHENGQLAERIGMRGGEPDGVSKAWYPSGAPKAEARMSAGKVVSQQFWEDGKAAPGAN